jgi:hypothetical protein
MSPDSPNVDGVPLPSTDGVSNSRLVTRTDAVVAQSGRFEAANVTTQLGLSAATYSPFEERRGFLDLPYELRQQIYRYAFRGAHFTVFDRSSEPYWGTPIDCTGDSGSLKKWSSIAYTCRTVYREAVIVLAEEARMSLLTQKFSYDTFPVILRVSYFPRLRNLRLGIPPAEFDPTVFPSLTELSFVNDLGILEDSPVDQVYLTEYCKRGEADKFLDTFSAPLQGGNDEEYIAQWMTKVSSETRHAALLDATDVESGRAGRPKSRRARSGPLQPWEISRRARLRSLRTLHAILHDSTRKFKITTTMSVDFKLILDCSSYNMVLGVVLVCLI